MNPTIRLMTHDDIQAGMHLKDQNGWNTLPDDWRRQLDLQPDGCFVAELDGQVVGTACACVFDEVAWINLVLVDKVHRGRGIGTSLMRFVLAHLDEQSIPSIRLDATPLGKPIYERLGFSVDYEITRYAGTFRWFSRWATTPFQVDVAKSADLPRVIHLDQHVTGTDRGRLIQYLFDRLDLFLARDEEQIVGFATIRPGANARHIGPCIGDTTSCMKLMAFLSEKYHGETVYMDIPQPHRQGTLFAEALELTPQRQLTRMTRGPRVQEKLDQYWCSFGPEKG